MRIDYVPANSIRPAEWKATYILRPDLKLLRSSIDDIGMRYPIMVREEDKRIIDGHARWLVALDHKTLSEQCPVQFVSCTKADAMVTHVRMNRGRGMLIAKDLSDLVNELLDLGAYSEEEVRILFGMTLDEFEVLVDGSLIKRKKLKDHKYNKAWVPIETKGPVEQIQIERPKTADR